jgi:hypothetical protein
MAEHHPASGAQHPLPHSPVDPNVYLQQFFSQRAGSAQSYQGHNQPIQSSSVGSRSDRPSINQEPEQPPQIVGNQQYQGSFAESRYNEGNRSQHTPQPHYSSMMSHVSGVATPTQSQTMASNLNDVARIFRTFGDPQQVPNTMPSQHNLSQNQQFPPQQLAQPPYNQMQPAQQQMNTQSFTQVSQSMHNHSPSSVSESGSAINQQQQQTTQQYSNQRETHTTQSPSPPPHQQQSSPPPQPEIASRPPSQTTPQQQYQSRVERDYQPSYQPSVQPQHQPNNLTQHGQQNQPQQTVVQPPSQPLPQQTRVERDYQPVFEIPTQPQNANRAPPNQPQYPQAHQPPPSHQNQPAHLQPVVTHTQHSNLNQQHIQPLQAPHSHPGHLHPPLHLVDPPVQPRVIPTSTTPPSRILPSPRNSFPKSSQLPRAVHPQDVPPNPLRDTHHSDMSSASRPSKRALVILQENVIPIDLSGNIAGVGGSNRGVEFARKEIGIVGTEDLSFDASGILGGGQLGQQAAFHAQYVGQNFTPSQIAELQLLASMKEKLIHKINNIGPKLHQANREIIDKEVELTQLSQLLESLLEQTERNLIEQARMQAVSTERINLVLTDVQESESEINKEMRIQQDLLIRDNERHIQDVRSVEEKFMPVIEAREVEAESIENDVADLHDEMHMLKDKLSSINIKATLLETATNVSKQTKAEYDEIETDLARQIQEEEGLFEDLKQAESDKRIVIEAIIKKFDEQRTKADKVLDILRKTNENVQPIVRAALAERNQLAVIEQHKRDELAEDIEAVKAMQRLLADTQQALSMLDVYREQRKENPGVQLPATHNKQLNKIICVDNIFEQDLLDCHRLVEKLSIQSENLDQRIEDIIPRIEELRRAINKGMDVARQLTSEIGKAITASSIAVPI